MINGMGTSHNGSRLSKACWFLVVALAFGFLPSVGAASLTLVGISVSLQDLCGWVVVLSMFGWMKPYIEAFITDGGEKVRLNSKRHKLALAVVNASGSLTKWLGEKAERVFSWMGEGKSAEKGNQGEDAGVDHDIRLKR